MGKKFLFAMHTKSPIAQLTLTGLLFEENQSLNSPPPPIQLLNNNNNKKRCVNFYFILFYYKLTLLLLLFITSTTNINPLVWSSFGHIFRKLDHPCFMLYFWLSLVCYFILIYASGCSTKLHCCFEILT